MFNIFFFLYLLKRIFPYLPIATKEVASGQNEVVDGELISILFTNVLQSNRDSDLLIDFILRKQPDIVLAVETDDYWVESLSKSLGKAYKASQIQSQDNLYGMALYTKLGVMEKDTLFQVQEDIPSFFSKMQTAKGRIFDFYGIHPRPPSPTEHDDAIPKDKELISTAKLIVERDNESPVIVGGDLNDVAWSKVTRVFQKISGLLDPRRGRGFYATFPAALPLLRCPIDQVFCSPHFMLKEIEVGPNFGSDHLPLFITLALRDEEVEENESLNALSEDHELADEIAELKVVE
ncbi:MAG: endonuclease [Saprospiraceae bacterium]|nr:endonuclease [Saprospiraceae bacterium]